MSWLSGISRSYRADIMAEVWLRRVGDSLFPDGDASICEFAKIPFGKPLRAEVKQPRNPAFHRLYFALCHRIAGGIGSDAETISNVFKFATDHIDIVKTKSYGEVKITKSISFAKMDNGQFRDFFDRCVSVAFTEWGLDATAFSDLLDQKTERHG